MDKKFWRLVGLGSPQQVSQSRQIDNAGDVNLADQASERASRSGDIIGDPSYLILSGAYFSRINLIRWDSVPYNRLAKEVRAEAVAKADLYLKQIDSERKETQYTGNANLSRMVEQIQTLLGEIEMSRMIAGAAYLYHNQSEGKFELVPFYHFTRSNKRDGDTYGQWRRGGANGTQIELTTANTIRIGIMGSIPAQAAAIQACWTYLTTTSAGNAILNKKVTGIDTIIALPASQEDTDEANKSLRDKHGGADKQQGIVAMSVGQGDNGDIKVHSVGRNDGKATLSASTRSGHQSDSFSVSDTEPTNRRQYPDHL